MHGFVRARLVFFLFFQKKTTNASKPEPPVMGSGGLRCNPRQTRPCAKRREGSRASALVNASKPEPPVMGSGGLRCNPGRTRPCAKRRDGSRASALVVAGAFVFFQKKTINASKPEPPVMGSGGLRCNPGRTRPCAKRRDGSRALALVNASKPEPPVMGSAV